jgi:hypothetical protein
LKERKEDEMIVYRQTFEVEGRCIFPVDMLRYDGCFPASEIEAGKIERALDGSNIGLWRVTLKRYIFDTKSQLPTFDRWKSFQATVDASSVRTERM